MTKEFKVLDKGFIRVVDKMGDDGAIVQAARVSYGQGTKSVNEDRALIRFLMRHRHTSPFEMCEIKLHLKMPMVIAEQLLRHRTANVNKYSGRYSEMIDEFYIPKACEIGYQSQNNKQCRDTNIPIEVASEVVEIIQRSSEAAYATYKKLLDKGVAREIARMVLPSNIYTQLYWKIDLHNLLHFIQLRVHQSAQYEIREYANVLEKIVQEWVPYTYEAFVDYRKEAVNVGKNVRKYLKRTQEPLDGLGKTEVAEFEENWKSAG